MSYMQKTKRMELAEQLHDLVAMPVAHNRYRNGWRNGRRQGCRDAMGGHVLQIHAL
jgi:hypothetical protein